MHDPGCSMFQLALKTVMVLELVDNYNFVFQNSCVFKEKTPRTPKSGNLKLRRLWSKTLMIKLLKTSIKC